MKIFKNIIKSIILKYKMVDELFDFYISKKNTIPSVITLTNPEKLKSSLFLPPSKFHSQLNQDIFALLINSFKKNLYFVEVGANDGYNLSNTLYLEEKFQWDGLLIEPNPRYFEKLKSRKAKFTPHAISDVNGIIEFYDSGLYGGELKHFDSKINDQKIIKVSGKNLYDIFKENAVPKKIDFISVDTEGGDLCVLEQICKISNHYTFTCGSIEHNYRIDDKIKIEKMLSDNGYEIVWRGKTQHDLFFINPRAIDKQNIL